MMKHLILSFPMRGRFLLVLLSMLTVSQLVMAQNYGYAIFDEETGALTFTADKGTPGTKKYNVTNNGIGYPSWYSIRSEVKKVVFDSSYANIKPLSCAYWFYGFTNMTSIERLEYLNTERVTKMSGMFQLCNKLQSIDISNFSTENVTSMSYMFSGCRGLRSIKITKSKFQTNNVTNMSYMFYYCEKLRSLDVSGFNTKQVTDMSYMFSGCSLVGTLDVSNFNTENVTNMKSMFAACSSVRFLDVTGFNTSKVTNMFGMFMECSSLQSLDVSEFDTSNVTNMGFMFSYCKLVPNINVSRFNTEKVTNMQNMFSTCTKITNIDVSNFNTENVTNMEGMFHTCESLTSLNLSNFETSNVTSMAEMFCQCYVLKDLDISSFNTGNVTNMYGMFLHCHSLPSIDISHFNTENVTNMNNMFQDCRLIKTLNVKGFNTTNVTEMVAMFGSCSNLLHLTFGENFITSKVTKGTYVFTSCPKLRYLDFYASNDDEANTYAFSNLDRTAKPTFLSNLPLTTVVYLPHGITKKNYTDPIDARYANLVFNDAENNRLIANSYYSEDKVDIEFPRDFITNKAEYSRTMSTTYGSAILPYEFKSNENIQAYTLDEEHTETMYFVDAETIPAHTPFAFKRLGKAEFIMEDESGNFGIMVKATQTTNAEEGGTPYTNSENLNGWTTKGYYINENVENYDKTFYIAKDKFYRADGELTMYPHRVTFHGTWETEPTIGEPAKFFEIATTDDLKTEDQVIADAIEAAEVRRSVCKAEVVYDLQGFKQPELRKGLNFIRMQDGTVKKVIVK